MTEEFKKYMKKYITQRRRRMTLAMNKLLDEKRDFVLNIAGSIKAAKFKSRRKSHVNKQPKP